MVNAFHRILGDVPFEVVEMMLVTLLRSDRQDHSTTLVA